MPFANSKAISLFSSWEKHSPKSSSYKQSLSEYSGFEELQISDGLLSRKQIKCEGELALYWINALRCIKDQDTQSAKQHLEKFPEEYLDIKSYGLALCAYIDSDYQTSKQLLMNALEAGASQLAVDMKFLMAKNLQKSGEFAQAYEMILEVLNYQCAAEILGCAAILAFKIDKLEESLYFADNALRLAPLQEEALLAKASCLCAKKDFEHARNQALMGVSLFSTNGQFWLLLSKTQLVRRQIDEAYSSINQALSYLPEEIGVWHIKGWCELLLGEISQAKSSFQKALNLNRNYSENHGGMAIVYAQLGDLKNADHCLQVALRLDRNCVSARYACSILARQHGNKAKSEELLQEVFELESHISGVTYKQLIGSQTLTHSAIS